MPDQTTILSLPLILPSQAQKHVTHNEALRILDVAVQLAVTNRMRTTAPAAPDAGDRYIIAAGSSGIWAGKAGQIAVYTEDGWDYTLPQAGWHAWIVAEGKLAVFDGTVWDVPTGGGNATTTPMLGINATADSTNRLSLSAPATLLNHEGAGHQLKVNKATITDTASLLFQTGFSGRAELGTMGNDRFALKVSANGSSFAEALHAEPATGHIRLPQGVLSDGFTLRDATDISKAASFSLSGIATGTIRSISLPNSSGMMALLSGSQTFTGATTFSGGLTVSAGFQVTGSSASLGTASTSASYGLGTGATASGQTKAIDIATEGLAGSTSAVTIGSAVSGALGSLTIHAPLVTYSSRVTDVDMGGANVTAAKLGINGPASSIDRLSLNSEGSLFAPDGAGHAMKIRKVGLGDTASLAFQSGVGTRADLGLIGNNSLTLRASADGSTFNTTFTVATTGEMTLAQPVTLAGLAADPGSPANGAIWHNASTGQVKARIGGVSKVIDAQMSLPHLVPVSGEYILSTTGGGGGATATLAGAAGRIDLFPYVARIDHAVDRLAVNVTTLVASALGKIVVYNSDSLGRPNTLILETADLDFSTTGVKAATMALTFRQGVTYWLGIRHSSTATLSAWALTATPDINGGAPVTTARKVLRRTLAYATAATTGWGFLSSEGNAANATAIWLRQV